jgi:hypothetical protein
MVIRAGPSSFRKEETARNGPPTAASAHENSTSPKSAREAKPRHVAQAGGDDAIHSADEFAALPV